MADLPPWPPRSPGTAQSGSSAPRIVGALGTNLGATQTVTFTTAEEVWLLGTLNANLTITLAGRTAGARCKLIAVQDGTGSRTVAFSDGSTSQAVSVTTTAGAGVEAQADCPNATDVTVFNPGGSGPQGPAGTQGIQGIQGIQGTQGTAGASGATQVVSPGNLGSAYTLDCSGKPDVLLVGTLNANCTITPTNMVAGQSITCRLTQDGTGSRTLAFSPTPKTAAAAGISVSTAAGAIDWFSLASYDGTALALFPLGKAFA